MSCKQFANDFSSKFHTSIQSKYLEIQNTFSLVVNLPKFLGVTGHFHIEIYRDCEILTGLPTPTKLKRVFTSAWRTEPSHHSFPGLLVSQMGLKLRMELKSGLTLETALSHSSTMTRTATMERKSLSAPPVPLHNISR